jgi:peptidoglycan hydrolase-like protein with peptidoglycan-binding domain
VTNAALLVPSAWRNTLRIFMNGPDVLALEHGLLERGYTPGNLDGLFDAETEYAVKRLQRAHGLKQDGIVGPITRKHFETPPAIALPAVGFVPAQITKLTRAQAAIAFIEAVERVTGDPPSVTMLACLLAQSALETGNWQKIWNFNFGNVKAGAGWRGLKTMFRCNEVIKGKVLWFDPPHPQTHFRAFANAADGAVDVVRFLAVDSDGDGYNRYAKSWSAAVAGDPERFAIELGNAGYYTANQATYVRGVKQIFASMLPVATQALQGRTPAARVRPATSDESLRESLAELGVALGEIDGGTGLG